MFEANKAEILRRMEKIRKHLARIDELIQCGEDKEDRWYPPEDPGFGPWVRFSGTECPVDGGDLVQWLLEGEVQSKDFWGITDEAQYAPWGDGEIVAYRVQK